MGRQKSNLPAPGTAVLGERLRQIRKDRGLTLAQLGTATGLSHAFLSQVERDLARPSMSTLDSIAAALRISPATLVSQTANGFARRAGRDETPTIPVGPEGIGLRPLTSRDALMKVTEVVGSFSRSERMSHAGEEMIYVIEGEVEIDVDGQIFRLGPGDALHFDCSIPHTYRALTDAPRFLVVAADPGQYASPVDESFYASRLA